MNYHDLSRAEERKQFPTVLEKLQRGELILPAVFVDDEVVNLGYVDYFSVAKAVERARSKEQTPS